MKKEDDLVPDRILQIGLGFWASKALLSAVELGVFTVLSKKPLDAKELTKQLGLHPRGTRDFFDALVAMEMLERNEGKYSNTVETAQFLDRSKQSYVGGMLEMANARLYPAWGHLTDALRTGKLQREDSANDDLFATVYANPQKLKQFLSAMTGVSMGAALALAKKFPWKDYNTVIDVGGAQGCAIVQVALENAHVRGGCFDLQAVEPIFTDYVHSFGLQERLKFQVGDFFKDALPPADVLVMGHILHDWGMADKKMLIRKAYDALSEGGVLIVYEALIDDDRRENAFGLLMSLNMLVETPEGFDYTGADASAWMREAGFRETRVEHLNGPDSMVVGIK